MSEFCLKCEKAAISKRCRQALALTITLIIIDRKNNGVKLTMM